MNQLCATIHREAHACSIFQTIPAGSFVSSANGEGKKAALVAPIITDSAACLTQEAHEELQFKRI